jgi:hypothetical protein
MLFSSNYRASRDPLCLQHELRREQRLFLVLRDFRALGHVGHELRAEGQRDLAAIDVARLLLVDDVEVVSTLEARRDVRVLAQLDVSVGAEDEQSSVTQVSRPSGVNQSTRMYPVPPLPVTIMSPKSSKFGYCW